MGLGKSAFTPHIYRDLPVDFYVPLFNKTHQSLNILLSKEMTRVAPKLYQIHDASLAHHQPYEVVVRSLRQHAPQLWQRLMSQYVSSEKFFKVNQLTQGSQELSALAAARFIHTLASSFKEKLYRNLLVLSDSMKRDIRYHKLVDKVDDLMDIVRDTPASQLLQMDDQQLQQMIPQLPDQSLMQQILNAFSEAGKNAVEGASQKVLNSVAEFKELKDQATASATALGGAGGNWYTHEALSVIQYLKEPDQFRFRAALLSFAFQFMKKFLELVPASLTHQQVVSMVGGISGVDRMLRESQLKDILPQELAALTAVDPKLQQLLKLDLLLRLSQKQVMVYQHSATVKPVVFLDKSGSMADGFKYRYGSDNVPKISAAAGFALALYQKLGADIYLFDTEVEGPIDRARVVNLLLTIKATGGTKIEEVLKKILEVGKKDYVYVVVTDAIDEVDEGVVRDLTAAGLKDNVRFVIVPPGNTSWWIREFRHVSVDSVASFITESIKVIR